MRRFVKWVCGILVVSVALAFVWLLRMAYFPAEQNLSLPAGIISLESAMGRSMLSRSTARTDYDILQPFFKNQIRGGYCGVASATAAVNALGKGPVTQRTFFEGGADQVKSSLAVTFSGMTVEQLGAMFQHHGLLGRVYHIEDGVGIDVFRSAAIRNLADPGDIFLVNYNRKTLDQVGGGHISPLGAYDTQTDRFLILDTAGYKYPPHWVETVRLYNAMNTYDSSGKANRGYVEVHRH